MVNSQTIKKCGGQRSNLQYLDYRNEYLNVFFCKESKPYQTSTQKHFLIFLLINGVTSPIPRMDPKMEKITFWNIKCLQISI